MLRPVSLAVAAAALVVGLSFAVAQPPGGPGSRRLADVFRVGHEVVVTEVADGTAFRVELLTDAEKADAERARDAAEKDATEAREAVEAASERLREAQKGFGAPAAAGDASGGEGVDPSEIMADLNAARRRRIAAERVASRRVYPVVEVGEDYFAYEAERRVHVPLARVVTVTRWTDK